MSREVKDAVRYFVRFWLCKKLIIRKNVRRWGLKLAERGGRSGKKRAIVATARKLAVLLHHLWVSGEVYEPLHNSNRVTLSAAA